jgi:hypothetical protein
MNWCETTGSIPTPASNSYATRPNSTGPTNVRCALIQSSEIGVAHSSAIACVRSANKSSGASIPTDSRIRLSEIPARNRASEVIPR